MRNEANKKQVLHKVQSNSRISAYYAAIMKRQEYSKLAGDQR